MFAAWNCCCLNRLVCRFYFSFKLELVLPTELPFLHRCTEVRRPSRYFCLSKTAPAAEVSGKEVSRCQKLGWGAHMPNLHPFIYFFYLFIYIFLQREFSFRFMPKKCTWKCQWGHYLWLELESKTGCRCAKCLYGFVIVANVNQFLFMTTIQNRAAKMGSARTVLQYCRSHLCKVEPKNEQGGLVSSEWFTIGHSISRFVIYFPPSVSFALLLFPLYA